MAWFKLDTLNDPFIESDVNFVKLDRIKDFSELIYNI